MIARRLLDKGLAVKREGAKVTIRFPVDPSEDINAMIARFDADVDARNFGRFALSILQLSESDEDYMERARFIFDLVKAVQEAGL